MSRTDCSQCGQTTPELGSNQWDYYQLEHHHLSTGDDQPVVDGLGGHGLKEDDEWLFCSAKCLVAFVEERIAADADLGH